MATAGSAGTRAIDTGEALTDIRERLATLMNGQVTPAVIEAGAMADAAINTAAGIVRERADAVTCQVRARPIGSVIVATAVGYVLGRMLH